MENEGYLNNINFNNISALAIKNTYKIKGVFLAFFKADKIREIKYSFISLEKL